MTQETSAAVVFTRTVTAIQIILVINRDTEHLQAGLK